MPRTVLVDPVPNRDITAAAREELRGHWMNAVLMTFAFAIVSFAVALWDDRLRYLCGVAWVASMGFAIGVNRFFLNRARGSEADDFSVLKLGFARIGNVVATLLLTMLWIFLKLLLLIIPGILAALDYAMVQFILADDPLLSPTETLRRSKAMMYGHRWQLIRLWFRFLGWHLLAIPTLGLALLWVWPYFQTSLCCFYESIRPLEAMPEPEKGLLIELTPVTETTPLVGAAPLVPDIPEASGPELPVEPYRGLSRRATVWLLVLAILLSVPAGLVISLKYTNDCRKQMRLAARLERNDRLNGISALMLSGCPDSSEDFLSGREFIDFNDLESLPRKILLLELPGAHPFGFFNVAAADGNTRTLRLKEPSCESFITLLKQYYDLDDGLVEIIRDAWPAQ